LGKFGKIIFINLENKLARFQQAQNLLENIWEFFSGKLKKLICRYQASVNSLGKIQEDL
jgi:hypothetical protein